MKAAHSAVSRGLRIRGTMSVLALGLTLTLASGELGRVRAQSPTAPALPTPGARKAAPEFVLKDLAGKDVKLSSFKGKVVILDFWATWCPPCRKGIPDLIGLHSAYQKAGLEVVGVSYDQNGATAVAPFVQSQKVNYTMLLMAGSPQSQTIAAQYVPTGKIPTMHIIDKQGRIAQSFVGLQPKQSIEAIVQTLLRER